MQIFEFPNKSPLPLPVRQAGPFAKGGKIILALGAESAGNFSIFLNAKAARLIPLLGKEGQGEVSRQTAGILKNHSSACRLTPPHPSPCQEEGATRQMHKYSSDKIFFSSDFGDLLIEKNYKKFQTTVLDFLKKNKLKPDIILTDLHPLYKTTIWGAELAKKFSAKGGSASGGKAKHIQIQHHLAHIFSAVGEKILGTEGAKLPIGSLAPFIGIALDGTGYGLDGKIWGGEIFQISPFSKGPACRTGRGKGDFYGVERIGHLENQIMIGGDLAVHEPARMLISILNKIKNQKSKIKITNKNLKLNKDKKFIYNFVKKYYTKNQFELLYNQLQNNFNCVETSSTGRILDAVSILLGFCGNKRNYKHEAADLLEKNSTIPYENLHPKLQIQNYKSQINSKCKTQNSKFILDTTYLFEYLLKNLHKNKHRLAATAQLYIAEGLYKIIKSQIPNPKSQIYLSGGIANNKIISDYFSSKGAFCVKKIHSVKSSRNEFNGVPRGDAGLSFGQICYYLSVKNL